MSILYCSTCGCPLAERPSILDWTPDRLAEERTKHSPSCSRVKSMVDPKSLYFRLDALLQGTKT